MTGFSHAHISEDSIKVDISIRSVNQKNLDLKINIDEKYLVLSESLQRILKKVFVRGRIDVSCVITVLEAENNHIFQTERLQEISENVQKCREIIPSFDPTLRLSDIIAWASLDTSKNQISIEKIKILVEKAALEATQNLLMMRRKEGSLLTESLLPIYENSVNLVSGIAASLESDFFARFEDLKKKAAGFLSSFEIKEERLYQECALLAEKSDFKEEIDRLKAHLLHFHEVCQNEVPKGRLLDFICQEMLRETNTLMSKAFQSSIIKEAIHLRAEVERLREQIQNIE